MTRAAIMLLACGAMAGGAQAQSAGRAFQAGGARVDITPSAAQARQAGYELHDPLNVRAIYLSNGQTCTVLVAVDQSNLENVITDDAIPRAARQVGCPAANFVISASHTHSGNTGGLAATGYPTFGTVADAIVTAARQAKATARPARVGYGTGQIDLNVNRDVLGPQGWMTGSNRKGVSDKTLAVLQVLDDTGGLIAAYYTYAMHAVQYSDTGLISADFPGAASAYIESRFPGSVALFSQSAGGDQNPLLIEPAHQVADLYAGRVDSIDTSLETPDGWMRDLAWQTAHRPQDRVVRRLAGARQEAYRQAAGNLARLVDGQGAQLGEAAIDIMRNLTPLRLDSGPILSDRGQFTCPGRDRMDDAIRQGSMPAYKDGAPVTVTVGALRIADIYLTWVNGEVFTDISTRLLAEAPVSHIMMATIANGRANVDYIYSNAASGNLTFEVLRSRLKPGCAEDRLVTTALKVIDRLKAQPDGETRPDAPR